MLRPHKALQTWNAAHTQLATSKSVASKAQVDPIFCPWLIKYGGKTGFSLSNSGLESNHICQLWKENPRISGQVPLRYKQCIQATYTEFIACANHLFEVITPRVFVDFWCAFGLIQTVWGYNWLPACMVYSRTLWKRPLVLNMTPPGDPTSWCGYVFGVSELGCTITWWHIVKIEVST